LPSVVDEEGAAAREAAADDPAAVRDLRGAHGPAVALIGRVEAHAPVVEMLHVPVVAEGQALFRAGHRPGQAARRGQAAAARAAQGALAGRVALAAAAVSGRVASAGLDGPVVLVALAGPDGRAASAVLVGQEALAGPVASVARGDPAVLVASAGRGGPVASVGLAGLAASAGLAVLEVSGESVALAPWPALPAWAQSPGPIWSQEDPTHGLSAVRRCSIRET